jgi:hypothetical protein
MIELKYIFELNLTYVKNKINIIREDLIIKIYLILNKYMNIYKLNWIHYQKI